MSHLTKQREEDARVRARMLKLLGWEAGQLHLEMEAQCLAWLDEAIGTVRRLPDGTPTLRRKLEANAGFRAWWANQWASLDGLLEANLKPVPVGDEWLLAYVCPKIGPTLYGSREAFRTYYLARHQLYMAPLRPDHEWLAKLALAAA